MVVNAFMQASYWIVVGCFVGGMGPFVGAWVRGTSVSEEDETAMGKASVIAFPLTAVANGLAVWACVHAKLANDSLFVVCASINAILFISLIVDGLLLTSNWSSSSTHASKARSFSTYAPKAGSSSTFVPVSGASEGLLPAIDAAAIDFDPKHGFALFLLAIAGVFTGYMVTFAWTFAKAQESLSYWIPLLAALVIGCSLVFDGYNRVSQITWSLDRSRCLLSYAEVLLGTLLPGFTGLGIGVAAYLHQS